MSVDLWVTCHVSGSLQGLFPDIWSYLQTGCWEAKTTPRGICDLQKALSFLNLKVTETTVVVVVVVVVGIGMLILLGPCRA